MSLCFPPKPKLDEVQDVLQSRSSYRADLNSYYSKDLNLKVPDVSAAYHQSKRKLRAEHGSAPLPLSERERLIMERRKIASQVAGPIDKVVISGEKENHPSGDEEGR
jgi:hypothetical protein